MRSVLVDQVSKRRTGCGFQRDVDQEQSFVFIPLFLIAIIYRGVTRWVGTPCIGVILKIVLRKEYQLISQSLSRDALPDAISTGWNYPVD